MSAAVSWPPFLRVLVAGGPKVGKTTFAAELGAALEAPVRNTDSIRDAFDWSGVSAEVARWFDGEGPWIIEGVAVPRALRKWLAAHPEGRPCDVVYWTNIPQVEQSKGQAAMAKGCATVWNEVRSELLRRGVVIREGLS